MPAKPARFPWATAAIAAVTIGAYLWSASRSDAALIGLVEAGGLRADDARPGRYLTSLLLHASALHLGMNVVLLGLFGPGVEGRVGALGLAFTYVLSGVLGGLAHVLLVPTALRAAALVGASGAVSGVLGAHAALLPRKRVQLALVVLWALVNLGGAVIFDRAGARGLSYAAHLGGLVAGALAGAVLGQLVGDRGARRSR
jgi:membrane associated rhomboid family serine protease